MKFTHKDFNKTMWVHPKRLKDHKQRWFVDASGMTLGRLAVEIAKKLQGKHQAYYCDMRDAGDYVVVINVDKMVVTGNKLATKLYYRYSGYKGNVKSLTLRHMMKSRPERVLMLAVKGMLPKNKLRSDRLARMKIFVGNDHPYDEKKLQPL